MDAPYYSGCSAESHRRKIITPYEPEPREIKKWCWRCMSWKLTVDFQLNNSRHDGYQSECRACNNSRRTILRRVKNGKDKADT